VTAASAAGVVWIELDKEHCGIHGTRELALIGRSESPGCVHLATWDAARMALMVSGRTGIEFRSERPCDRPGRVLQNHDTRQGLCVW
jgi:hypothetical protein